MAEAARIQALTKDSINRTNQKLTDQKKHLDDINITMDKIVCEMDRITSFSWWTPPITLIQTILGCFFCSAVLLAIPYLLEYYDVDVVSSLGMHYNEFKIWAHQGHSSPTPAPPGSTSYLVPENAWRAPPFYIKAHTCHHETVGIRNIYRYVI